MCSSRQPSKGRRSLKEEVDRRNLQRLVRLGAQGLSLEALDPSPCVNRHRPSPNLAAAALEAPNNARGSCTGTGSIIVIYRHRRHLLSLIALPQGVRGARPRANCQGGGRAGARGRGVCVVWQPHRRRFTEAALQRLVLQRLPFPTPAGRCGPPWGPPQQRIAGAPRGRAPPVRPFISPCRLRRSWPCPWCWTGSAS